MQCHWRVPGEERDREVTQHEPTYPPTQSTDTVPAGGVGQQCGSGGNGAAMGGRWFPKAGGQGLGKSAGAPAPFQVPWGTQQEDPQGTGTF